MVAPKLIFVELATIAATATAILQNSPATQSAGPMSWVDRTLSGATVVFLLGVMLQLAGIRERMKHLPTKEEMTNADNLSRHAIRNEVVQTLGKIQSELVEDIRRLEGDIRENRQRIQGGQ